MNIKAFITEYQFILIFTFSHILRSKYKTVLTLKQLECYSFYRNQKYIFIRSDSLSLSIKMRRF